MAVSLERNVREESSVKEVVTGGGGFEVFLESGKRVFLDFCHDGGRGKDIMTGDIAAIDYFPRPATPVMATVNFTVRRREEEIFRDNISRNRVRDQKAEIS